MKIAAITINKGGVGKTMLARSLGTAAAAAGKLVLILDMDTQQNSTTWQRRRPAELPLPHVQFTTEVDLVDTLRRARGAGCELVLIDTPPGRSTEAVAAVDEADLVLIPCTSETECFEGLPRTARVARLAGKRAVVVANFLHPSGRVEAETIRGVAAGHQLETAPVVLHEYQIHREGSFQGKTAQEMAPDSKAGAEIGALWRWFCAQIDLPTAAFVQEEA